MPDYGVQSPDSGVRSTNLPSSTIVTEVIGNKDLGGGKSQTVRIPVGNFANILAPYGTHVVFGTLAQLNASLAYPANTGGEVWADSTDANNGIYRKLGASGSGSWTWVASLSTTQILDRIAALEAIGGDANLAAIADLSRPGERPALWASGLPGSAEADTPPTALTTNAAGDVAYVDGAKIVATTAVYRLEPGHTYRARFVVWRLVDPVDPAGDSVRLAIQWLRAKKTALSQTTVVNIDDLVVASYRQEVTAIISGVSGGDVTWPSGAIYAAPFVQTYGSICRTAIEVIEWRDITDVAVIAPNVDSISARVSALETIQIGDQLAAINTALLEAVPQAYPATTTALAALDTDIYATAYLLELGREGRAVLLDNSTGDYDAAIADDPGQGRYVESDIIGKVWYFNRQKYLITNYGAAAAGPDDINAGQDNSQAIQAALSDRRGSEVVIPNGYFLTSGGPGGVLQVYDNTRVIHEEGARVCSQIVFGGWNSGLYTAYQRRGLRIEGPGGVRSAPPRTVTGTLTSGSAVIASVSSMTHVTVNMPISGGGIPDGARIASVDVGASTITMSQVATESGASTVTCHYTGSPFLAFIDCPDISLSNGLRLLDTKGSTDSAYATRTLLEIRDFSIKDIYCGWEGIDIESQSPAYAAACDFIHLLGGTTRGDISGLHGISGDDAVALNIEPFQPVWDRPISHINVSNSACDTTWAQLVRLYLHADSKSASLSDVNIDNITGRVAVSGGNAAWALSIADNSLRSAIKNINIYNFIADCSLSAGGGIEILSADSVSMQSTNIIGQFRQAIYAKSSSRVTMISAGFRSTPRTTDPVYQAHFEDCGYTDIIGGEISNGVSHNLYFKGCVGGTISGLKSLSASGDAVVLDNTSGMDISLSSSNVSGFSNKALEEINGSSGNSIKYDGSPNDITHLGGSNVWTEWGNFTPTVAASTGSFSSVMCTGTYRLQGTTADVSYSVVVDGSGIGTASGSMYLTAPTAIISGYGNLSGSNNTSGALIIGAVTGDVSKYYAQTAAGAFPVGNSHTARISGSYRFK
jgi:hypothetical protein